MFAHQKTKSFQLPPTLNHRRPTIQERFTIKPCKQNLKETNPRNRWSRGKKERWVLEKIDLVIKQMKKMDTDESRSERGCLKSVEGCPTKQIKKALSQSKSLRAPPLTETTGTFPGLSRKRAEPS